MILLIILYADRLKVSTTQRQLNTPVQVLFLAVKSVVQHKTTPYSPWGRKPVPTQLVLLSRECKVNQLASVVVEIFVVYDLVL